MVVKLRLQRYGRKAAPFYKIVATDARKARDGKPIEYIGTYSPKIDKNGQKELRLHEGRVKYWLSVGAQPTETVSRLLGYAQILPPPPYTKKTKRHIPKADRAFSTTTKVSLRPPLVPEVVPTFVGSGSLPSLANSHTNSFVFHQRLVSRSTDLRRTFSSFQPIAAAASLPTQARQSSTFAGRNIFPRFISRAFRTIVFHR